MRILSFAGGLLCLAPFAACDESTICATPACDLGSVSEQQPPLTASDADDTGAFVRYVHATISLEAPFAMQDWCVNVSLVTKSSIDAQGVFCLSQFETAPNALLANLRCDPESDEALVVTVEDIDYEGSGDWSDGCGAFGCTRSIACDQRVTELSLTIPIGKP